MSAYASVLAYLRAKAGMEPPAGTAAQTSQEQARLDALGERMRTLHFGPAMTKDELAAAFRSEAVRQAQGRYR